MKETGVLEYVILAGVLLLCLLYVGRSIRRMFGKKRATPDCGCSCGQPCSPATLAKRKEKIASRGGAAKTQETNRP